MLDSSDLSEALEHIHLIDQAGELSDYRADLYDLWKGQPKNPLDACTPNQRVEAQLRAREMSRCFGVSYRRCLPAACKSVGIVSRQRIASDLASEYVQRIRDDIPKRRDGELEKPNAILRETAVAKKYRRRRRTK